MADKNIILKNFLEIYDTQRENINIKYVFEENDLITELQNNYELNENPFINITDSGFFYSTFRVILTIEKGKYITGSMNMCESLPFYYLCPKLNPSYRNSSSYEFLSGIEESKRILQKNFWSSLKLIITSLTENEVDEKIKICFNNFIEESSLNQIIEAGCIIAKMIEVCFLE